MRTDFSCHWHHINYHFSWLLKAFCLLSLTITSVVFFFLFQEIETEQFFNFFLPELQQHGYDGIFSPKSRARTMTEEDRKYVDGCAIFYRTSK